MAKSHQREPLSPLGQRILQHYRKYLPKTTAELEKRGTLHQVISGLADPTEEQLNDLHNQGVASTSIGHPHLVSLFETEKGNIMIQGFPFVSSLFPGDTLRLHVSTDAPQFRVDIYRQGASLALVLSSDWLSSPGINSPDHESDQDWSQDQTEENGVTQGWAPFDVAIPSDFTSGVYVAMFVEGDGNGNPSGNTPPLDTTTPDARFGKALFVIRSPAPGTSASILYKLPLFTYHAYNDVGGWALYTPPQTGPEPQEDEPTFVSLRRPGGGTGGHPWDDWNFDPADRSSPRQVFAHWDAPFIAWLEQNEYRIDYATDLDLHSDPNLLAPYSLVLSVGHDEYWTKEMRDQAEAFIRNGGNFAFFSGNTCWWVVEFDGDSRFQRTANWWNGANRPENSLTRRELQEWRRREPGSS